MSRRKTEHYSNYDWNQIVSDYHSNDEKLKKKATQQACDALKYYVISVMKKKYPTYIEKEGQDLIQSGYLGIIQSLDGYDPKRGAPTTYFDFYIGQAMQLWLNSQKNQSSIHYQTANNKIQAAIRYYEANEIPWDDVKISERTGLPLSTIKNTLAIVNKASALEINEEIKTGNGDETITPEAFGSPEDELIIKEKNDVLYSCVSELSDVEQYILIHVYGLAGYPRLSHKDIAKRLNLTLSKVKTIQSRAIAKLKKSKLSSLVSDKYNESERWLEGEMCFFPETDDTLETADFQMEDFEPEIHIIAQSSPVAS